MGIVTRVFLYALIYPESSSFPPQNSSIKTGRLKGKSWGETERDREREGQGQRQERKGIQRERERHATEVESVKYMSNRRRIDRGKVISLALRFFFFFFSFLSFFPPFFFCQRVGHFYGKKPASAVSEAVRCKIICSVGIIPRNDLELNIAIHVPSNGFLLNRRSSRRELENQKGDKTFVRASRGKGAL